MGAWHLWGSTQRGGGGPCEKRGWPSVAVTGDGDEREPSTQSKNVNGVPMMHIKRTSARRAALSSWLQTCSLLLFSMFFCILAINIIALGCFIYLFIFLRVMPKFHYCFIIVLLILALIDLVVQMPPNQTIHTLSDSDLIFALFLF